MIESLTFTGRELLMAIVLATVVYLLEVLVFSPRRKPPGLDALENRIQALQVEIDALKARLELLELHPPAESALDTHSAVHAEAVRMAREGATPAEMADRLGISRGEAELITALLKGD
jgi:hypothetical protein